MRVLVIEDDPVIATMISKALQSASIRSEIATLGEEGLEIGKLYNYDAIILDLMLPDVHGHAVLDKLRKARIKTPVIIVSALHDVHEKVKSLGFGADDYLTKPFNRSELLARVNAVVRRSNGHAESIVRIGRLTVNFHTNVVEADGSPLALTAKEHALLRCLALKEGATLTKEHIADQIYGDNPDQPDQKIIDVFVCKLRKKLVEALGAEGEHYIKTIWGRGYSIDGRSIANLDSGKHTPSGNMDASFAHESYKEEELGAPFSKAVAA